MAEWFRRRAADSLYAGSNPAPGSKKAVRSMVDIPKSRLEKYLNLRREFSRDDYIKLL